MTRKDQAPVLHQPILGRGLCACGCGKPATRNYAHGHRAHNGPVEFWRRIPTHLGPDECWPWPGPFSPAGYGAWGPIKVHREMYEQTHGPIPPGLAICHHCDNPPCCNPAHLFAATQANNIEDMVVKGRAPSSIPRLTGEQVDAIRQRYAAGEASMRALATEYEISPTHARCIIRRLKWRDRR